ncbi:MAG: type II methionyl aminopeptidase [Candidatus Bathyarchaeota archaeon]|nr:MAG: type II methionyl aminopeptidase [Candidatus Bathyarchaeota archaeon]
MEATKPLMEAGRIAAKAREEARSFVDVGKPVIEICDFVEETIKRLGGEPAFPCNVDIDSVAAHYTSPAGDTTIIPQGSLVKVDIGVHVDGYIADTAVTVCFEPSRMGLVEAAEAGLDAAISNVRTGARASDIGATIERAIRGRGAIPIRNLTGHMMTRYLVHAGQSIPNISGTRGQALMEGEVYAIEPFAVPQDAAGNVTDGAPSNIYQFRKKRNVRGDAAKRMLKFIQSSYRTLPFASRWVLCKFPGSGGSEAFSELLGSKCIYSYPQLVERSHAPVAQAEHTVIVTGDGCVVTTA